MVKKSQATRDKEPDELNAPRFRLDQQDVEIWNKETVEAWRRGFLPAWIVERMQEEAIKKFKIYWLEPNTSFSVSNVHDNTLDFSMATKACFFWCFNQTVKASMSNIVVNKKFFKFYEFQLNP